MNNGRPMSDFDLLVRTCEARGGADTTVCVSQLPHAKMRAVRDAVKTGRKNPEALPDWV